MTFVIAMVAAVSGLVAVAQAASAVGPAAVRRYDAGSASIRWVDGDQEERLALERECASKISVRAEGGSVQFHLWSRSQGLGGELVVRVGEGVSASDILLRV